MRGYETSIKDQRPPTKRKCVELSMLDV